MVYHIPLYGNFTVHQPYGGSIGMAYAHPNEALGASGTYTPESRQYISKNNQVWEYSIWWQDGIARLEWAYEHAERIFSEHVESMGGGERGIKCRK